MVKLNIRVVLKHLIPVIRQITSTMAHCGRESKIL
jgi:hypothetical protein